MGNLWGDLLKPGDFAGLPDAMIRGILLHRHIDRFTDSHPDVMSIRNLVRPAQGKYTPVVVDVLMDFILSQQWARYHEIPLDQFCEAKYRVVEANLDLLPARHHPRVRRMLDHRWLESCAGRERMAQTLVMLGRRAAFDNVIWDALEPYDRHAPVIDGLFGSFFAALRLEVSLQSEG